VLRLLRSRKITIGVFTTEVNSVNHSRLFDTGKGIFPDPHKEWVASPRVLSLKHHTYQSKNLVQRKRERKTTRLSQQRFSTAEGRHPLQFHAVFDRLESGLIRKAMLSAPLFGPRIATATSTRTTASHTGASYLESGTFPLVALVVLCCVDVGCRSSSSSVVVVS
jgi:hypothetical protein